MRLSLIVEAKNYINLFHGTPISNLNSIKKLGLNWGESGRAFFGLTPGQSYAAEEDLLVEIMISKHHHDLADPYLDYEDNPRIAAFDDHDRELMLTSPKMADTARQYWAAIARQTKEKDIDPDKLREVSLPVPIGFSGKPRIVGIYVVKMNVIDSIEYWSRGASLDVGYTLRTNHLNKT